MPESPIEIAQRLEMRGADSSPWIAVFTTDDTPENAFEGFATDVSSLLQKSTRRFVLTGTTFEQLTESLHNPADDIAILIVDTITSDQWSTLDIMRSALERKGPIIIWGSLNSFQYLSEYAPNIRSYLGSSFFAVGPDGGIMTREEQMARLQELRDHYGLTDDEIIEQAESRSLSREPHIKERHDLLGRGDLV